MLLVSSLKAKATIKYPNLPSAIRPIPHSADLSPSLLTSFPEVADEPVSSTSEYSCLENDCYEPVADNKFLMLITQAILNGLVRDLDLLTIFFHAGNICVLSQCCRSSSSDELYI